MSTDRVDDPQSAERVTFRSARRDDARELTELARASKRYWGYSDAQIELWRGELEFTAETIRSQTVIVAEVAGEIVGVCAFSRCGETAELEHLWVHASRVRQGIGRALFHEAISAARERGALSVFITSDPNAEGFYVRMGASSVGSVPSKPPGRQLPRLLYSISGPARDPKTGGLSIA